MCRIKGEYAPAKEIAKLLRAPLRKRWGTKFVQVRTGTGTASSWVHADVQVKAPANCYCTPQGTYCGNCKERLQESAAEARRLVLDTMKEADAQFSTYYGDMGNEPNDEFLLQVTIIKE